MSNFTTTTNAVFLPEVWSNKTLDETESKLVAAKLVSRYDADVSQKGDVVHIPEVSNFTQARDKSADTDVTFDAITEGEKTININNHKYVAFVIEDIVSKQSAYDIQSKYTQKAGYEIAKAVDTSILSLYSDFTTTDAGSYESDLSAATMVSGIQQLMVSDVPREDMAFIIHADQGAALMNVEELVKADYMGEYDKPTTVRKGPNSNYLWGTLYGIPVYYSTNVQTTSGTTTQGHNVLIHKEAWALAMQQSPEVKQDYLLEKLGDGIVVSVLYGVKTTRTDFGVELRSRITAT